MHGELSRLIARLGHTDLVVIGDRGLPLPPIVPVVDLALVPGVVAFRTVLDAVLSEIVVEAHLVAAEAARGPVTGWLDERADHLGRREVLSHEDLKAVLPRAAVAIRTGEQTPYANIVLR